MRCHNGITLVGINDMFDQYFDAGSGLTWYVGLIDNDNFTALDDDNDTMASHAGWVEITDYNEATRPAWGPDSASGQAKTNSVKRDFTMSSGQDIKGMFLASDNAKGGTSGILWCTGIFSTVSSVQVNQVAKVYYELTGQEG